MTKTKHILIAEDDTFLAEIMEKALQAHGASVSIAHDGQKAIDAMDASAPQLLLLDLLMPHVDGFAILAHIRERKYLFPVVVLSNLSDEENREKCNKLGVDGYFVKSDMDDDQLWSIVKQYLPKS